MIPPFNTPARIQVFIICGAVWQPLLNINGKENTFPSLSVLKKAKKNLIPYPGAKLNSGVYSALF
jgi:hypothetical protein